MKKNFLALVFLGIFFICGFSVSATTNFTSPVASGNYSATLNITLNTNISNATNTTCYYNFSGGAATTFLTEILNDSASDVLFDNGSIDLTGFSETSTYNISCTVYGDTNETASLENITIDNTAPLVGVSKISGVSYSTQSRANGTFVLNVSVSDSINVSSVYFNLTNATGVQDAIYYAAREGSSNNWVNSTGFNISKFTQGAYTITVYANDTLGNLNSTENSGTIYFDSVSPSSIVLTLFSRGASSLSIDVEITDNVGISSTCTVDRDDANVSDTDSTQRITESGLGCSHTYSYVAICSDRAGNSNSSVSTSFTTAACAASSGGLSSSTSSQWTNTYLVKDSQFETGYSRKLSSKQRMKVSLGNESHYIGVKNLTNISAVIEISSDPIKVTFNIGEEKKFDLNSDSFYDLQVELLDINNSKANVSIQKIHEEIVIEEDSTSTQGNLSVGENQNNSNSEINESKNKSVNLSWLWWLMGIIIFIILVISGWFAYNNYKNNMIKGKKKK